MNVKVKIFGPLRKHVPAYDPEQALEVEIPVGAKVKDLLAHLKIPASESSMVFVNDDYAEEEDALTDGVSVRVLPFIGGG